MPLSWPWKKPVSDPTLRSAWDYEFHITPLHMTIEERDRLKQSYDSLADKAYAILASLSADRKSKQQVVSTVSSESLVQDKIPTTESIPDTPSASIAQNSNPRPKRDLYALLRDNFSTDPILEELWIQANEVPEWVDWNQISRGQEVFYRYGAPALMGLAFQSLLGGMGSGRVVETLSRTGAFSTRVARHRLLETTQHTLQCTKSLQSLQPGGDGFASSIRVRLLHAAVRTGIMKLARQDPNYYDLETLGVPVNDLDCIATVVSFSSSLIWVSFPRQGIFISQQEAEDYIAMWRYIAYLTGTPTDYFSSPEKAKLAMETLLLYEINPTETSKILAHNVIESLALQPPNYPSREFLEAFARWLNGDALCDALGLGRPSLYYWALVTGQVLFSMWMSYTTRIFRVIDQKKIAVLRKVFWDIIVEGKDGLGSETLFDYKYIPRLGKLTKPGKGSKHANAQNKTERTNLLVFIGASITTISLGVMLLAALPSIVLRARQAIM